MVNVKDGAAQDTGQGEGVVKAEVGGGVGGDVEEGVFVEAEVMDSFEGGGDRGVFLVLFAVEEVGLVGVGDVEDGNLGGVNCGWWEKGKGWLTS